MSLAIPNKGLHRFHDMLSEESSLETKANASRWYAEMMIDLFLSEEAKELQENNNFNKLSLGEKIPKIKPYCSDEIINCLYLIKEIGDDGSHYNPESSLNKNDVKKVVQKSINLFTLILIDHIKKEPLEKTFNRATIFSTIFPSIRKDVLYSLIDFNIINTEKDYALLHKYILACVKSNHKDQIIRKLNKLQKKNIITNEFYEYEIKSIQVISNGMKNNELPIANSSEDCKRNFNSVISTLNSNELEENKGLIKIINTLLDDFEESDIGVLLENQIYLIT